MKRRPLTPAQVKALHWLPGDVQIARLATCDGTRRTPRQDTLLTLERRGFAYPVTWTGWWRITPAGLEARATANGAFPEQRVTT